MTPERRQRLLVLATASIAGLYMANLILIEPLFAWGTRRAQQIEKLRKQVRSGEQLIGRADRVQDVWNRIRTHAEEGHAEGGREEGLTRGRGGAEAWREGRGTVES